MNKSVRSVRSRISSVAGETKREKEQRVKQRVQDIMSSVKEEKQHIQNLLHQNDKMIQELAESYQSLRYDHDFEHLNREEEILLDELIGGLNEAGIDPPSILGENARLKRAKERHPKMEREQIIKVQQMIISKLLARM